MEKTPIPDEPQNLKFLRRMVNVLTFVMISGVVIITAMFVIRFSSAGKPTLPDQITLPGGEVATAFTQGTDWYAVVTQSNKILIFNRDTGALQQTVEIKN